MCLCESVPTCVQVPRGGERAPSPLELNLEEFVSHLKQVLASELRSSGRASLTAKPYLQAPQSLLDRNKISLKKKVKASSGDFSLRMLSESIPSYVCEIVSCFIRMGIHINPRNLYFRY